MIVACGPWANKLTRGLGGVVPLALSRGQAGRFRPPHAFGLPGPIISDHAHELWIKPEGNDGHYLIGGRGGRLDRSPHKRPTGQAGADDAMLETFAGELAHRFPGMAGGVWRGSWSSFYDFTPDGNPVIDRIPGRAQPDHRDGHVGPLLQARALARPRHRRAGRRWPGAQLRLVGVRLRALRARAATASARARAGMIGGVLLAAGAGSRFRAAGGGVKLLAPVDGRPLVEWALAALAAAPLGDRVIVLGAHADELLAAIDLHGARPVRNEDWERGMASSLQAGLAALDPACTAAVVVLGDGPALAAEAIRRVAVAAEGRHGLVAATLRRRAAAIRWRSRARSGRGCRRRASRAPAPSASRPSWSTAAICRAPGDADTPADLAARRCAPCRRGACGRRAG